MKTTTLFDAVEEYYLLVDQSNFGPMYDLFSDDILYRRCDKIIEGKDAFRKFYEKERTIRGRHFLSNIVTSNEAVGIEGTFVGTRGEGEEISEKFADIFHFKQGLIYERNTYLPTDRIPGAVTLHDVMQHIQWMSCTNVFWNERKEGEVIEAVAPPERQGKPYFNACGFHDLGTNNFRYYTAQGSEHIQ